MLPLSFEYPNQCSSAWQYGSSTSNPINKQAVCSVDKNRQYICAHVTLPLTSLGKVFPTKYSPMYLLCMYHDTNTNTRMQALLLSLFLCVLLLFCENFCCHSRTWMCWPVDCLKSGKPRLKNALQAWWCFDFVQVTHELDCLVPCMNFH